MRIGIDLGETNSMMAYYDIESETTELIRNDRAEVTTPSALLIEEDTEEGERITVGEAARARRGISPERVLTRSLQDIDKEEEVTYQIGDTEYTPVQAATYILAHLKEQAERSLDEEVEGAVITVPYYLANRGRERIRTAAEVAGLEIHEFIDEPTAACLSYIHQEDIEGTVLVYDLGGGTFDATLVEVGTLVNVISAEGDGGLGGEDFDDALYEFVSDKIVDEGGPDPADAHEQDQAALRSEVEHAKHALSHLSETMFVWEGTEVEVPREAFESVIDEYIQRTIDKMDALFETDAVQDAGISKDDVDHVLLVGGSTRVPLVRERVEAFFEQEPRFDIDPDTVAARGAALQAAEHRDDSRDGRSGYPDAYVLPYNIGIESYDGTFYEIIEAGVGLPTDVTVTYTNPRDNGTGFRIPLWMEGEHGEPVDSAEQLGGIVLEGLPERPAGELDIEGTLVVDHDGSLHAEAVETGTGTTVEATLESDSKDPLSDRYGEEFDLSRPGLRDDGIPGG